VSANPLLTGFAYPASAQCTVDVDGDRRTTAAEVVGAVNLALSGCPQSGACPGDADGDGRITVDELVRAVDDALNGCRRTFFVRRAGNDNRDGATPATALRTIGAAVARMGDGDTVVVGPGTYAESILEPQSKIVEGFPPAMPTFKGQLSDRRISGLVEYIKGPASTGEPVVKAAAPGAEGAKPAEPKGSQP